MSGSVGFLHRTNRSSFTLYSTDGLGRDTYISYNNGGFWQDNMKTIFMNDKFDVPKHKSVHSLRKNVAPFKYYSDGSGRDSYVIHESGGLKKDHKPLQNYQLKDFLRTPESAIFNFKASPMKEGIAGKTKYISKKEFRQNLQLKEIEKGLKDRLYYSEKHKFCNDRQPLEQKPKKFQLLLRSYEGGFPQIEKNAKTENLRKSENFTNKLKCLTNYSDKNLKELVLTDRLKAHDKEYDNLAKKHINFSKTSSNFRSKSINIK